MKLPRSALLWVAAILMAAGVGHTFYRHLEHDVPWFPGTTQELWDVEAMIEFRAGGEPARVRLAVPDTQTGFVLQGENTASPGYGIHSEHRDGQRYVEWTAREARGAQVVYYRGQYRTDPQAEPAREVQPPDPREVIWSPPLQTAANQILRGAYQESADAFSLARAITARLGDSEDQNAQLLLSEFEAAEAMVRLLNQAEVPARSVRGLNLEDGRRRQSPIPVVQVFDDDNEWQLFFPGEERPAQSEFLLWERTGGPLLEVEGGSDSRVTFSMLKTSQPITGMPDDPSLADAVFNLTIHSLPISEQAIFMSILLLPIGAMIVVLARVFVGIETSGTFMPVLLALAFLKMSLLSGIVTFLLVIGFGLLLRQALAHLNLLLVARVSVVIICVIGLISLFSVLSFHAGIDIGLKMAFFPIIILAWTIERMSILWEENGPREVAKQGSGSLITAIAAYSVMALPWVQHWMFNFLGLQLVVLALIILAGSYTGYRVSELWRFRPFLQEGARG